MASADGTTVHTYLYDNSGALIRETRDYPDGTQDIMEFLYDQSGRPYAFVLNNVTYYYVLNLQGDIVRLVNTAGTTVVSYVYNAWGKILSTQTTSLSYSATVAAKNPLRYRGYYYDTESQLYYCQSRYYDPAIGRFINADAFTSTGQGILGNNMFVYCLNNPVNNSDPSGELGIVGIGIIVSAAIGGVVSAAGTAVSGASVAEVVASFAIGALTAGSTAAVAAVSGISLGMAAVYSAGIGFAGEAVSQAVEYGFHHNDEEYEFNATSSIIKLAYASGMGALGGYVSTGINNVFKYAEKIGLFVSGMASTCLGSVDFGTRQIITAVTKPKPTQRVSNQTSGSAPSRGRSVPRNYVALPV